VASGERLDSAGLQASEVLRASPGVQITQLGGMGAPATASLRGATAAQTPVYLAGIRLNDEVGGAANLADVPLFLMDRVEIYRSHTPLVADRLGVGGAVFFEPKRPTEQQLGVGGLAGSYGTRAGWAYLGAGDDLGGVLAGVQLSGAANDYPFFDGGGTLYRSGDDHISRLPNADMTSQNVWLSGRRALGRAWLSMLLNHATREQGAPKLASVPSEQARIEFRRDLVGLRTVVPVEEWRGSLQARTSVVDSATTILDPQVELGLLTPKTSTPGIRVEQTLGARHKLGSLGLAEQASLSVERLRRLEQVQSASELALSARRGTARLALSAELGLTERLFVETAGALECWKTSTTELGLCDELAPTGRLGTSYRAPSFELYANGGRYHRLPTLSELYGASLLMRGDDDLDPEAGTSLEVGGRWQLVNHAEQRLLWVDTSAFARFSEDLIVYVRSAQGHMDPLNRDRARTLGAEALVGGAPLEWLESEVSVSLLDPRDTSPSRQTVNDLLPFHSRLIAGARLTATQEFAGVWLSELRLSVMGLYQASRYADPAGLGVIPEQQTVEFEAGATLWAETLRAALRLANVFDTQRFDIVGFPLPGRSGFFSMEARL
jgi:iron complex outermembrane receptor protein